MTREEISKLSDVERLAGYLLASAKLAAFGAKVRKDDRPDSSWTKEEEDEWDQLADDLDSWAYSLSEKDKKILKKIEWFVADLTCGLYPEEE